MNWLEDEVVDMPETEIVEENIYLDEELLKNKSLIRVDMNAIQYPLFSRNPKRKVNQIVKYFFNQKRDIYINVVPMNGNYIPGELEEKIFITLMKLMKKKGMQRRFIVTANELKKELNMNTKDYVKRVKDALIRLASTNYQFKNTLYSNKEKSLLTKEVHTTIMSLEILRLEEEKNKSLKEKISDKRIKEAYEISVSDYFYDNLVSKGYLVYDSDILLTIDNGTSRTIYMLIEKLRFNDLYLKVDILFLIKRIPLKYDKKNIARTIQTIGKSLEELKEKNLIKNFNFIKDTTWEKSEVEIFFSEANLILKQDRFYTDLNDFKRMTTSLAISGMEHEPVLENLLEKKEEITLEVISEIMSKLPSVAKKLKTMPKTIKDSIDYYGIEKVLLAVQYLKKQKNLKSPRAYFLKSLENNWFDGEVLEVSLPKKESKSEDIALEILKNEKINDNLYQEFEKLPINIQNGIEGYVYREYIELCGMETKIQQLAFMGSRKKLICDYLQRYPQILENEKEIKVENENSKVEDTTIIDRQKLKEYIDEYIELYQDLMKIEYNNIESIRKKIILECMDYFINKNLTLEKLKEIIKTNFL
ncbi:MAG: hypothetical protein ACRCZO_05960 [Cetobacterium sp.]|uniref:hypothetical protein n=1 Tax=Cetobacterium sp. TaxID=2071632 RepID=UPI003F3BE7D0